MIYLNKKDINKVASLFNDNKLIAFPTETVYGLGIIATSNENFNRLVEVKHRSPNKPFTLMISNILQVKDIIEINDLTKKILELFTPGPLTLILKTKNTPKFREFLNEILLKFYSVADKSVSVFVDINPESMLWYTQ